LRKEKQTSLPRFLSGWTLTARFRYAKAQNRQQDERTRVPKLSTLEIQTSLNLFQCRCFGDTKDLVKTLAFELRLGFWWHLLLEIWLRGWRANRGRSGKKNNTKRSNEERKAKGVGRSIVKHDISEKEAETQQTTSGGRRIDHTADLR
jgi:hypothetical protein